jgi:hypothetical protein
MIGVFQSFMLFWIYFPQLKPSFFKKGCLVSRETCLWDGNDLFIL